MDHGEGQLFLSVSQCGSQLYTIEIGRIDNSLWLSVDGEKIIETVDESILPGGHVVFRVRGTAGFKAACLIKEVEIYSEKQ